MTRRGVILLGAVPIAIVSGLVGLEEGFAAWSRWAYLLFFLYGFLVAADQRAQAAMRRDAPVAAALGIVLFGAAGAEFAATADAGVDPLTAAGPLPTAGRFLYGAAGWCWLVAILGLLGSARGRAERARPAGSRSVRRRWYGYLSEAVLPLYILHQPVVVAVAYGVVRWDAPMLLKYVILVSASLALAVAAYDVLVRRTAATRFLFGMRPRRQVTEEVNGAPPAAGALSGRPPARRQG